MDTFLFKKADVVFKKLVSAFIIITFVLTLSPVPSALALRNPQASNAPAVGKQLGQDFIAAQAPAIGQREHALLELLHKQGTISGVPSLEQLQLLQASPADFWKELADMGLVRDWDKLNTADKDMLINELANVYKLDPVEFFDMLILQNEFRKRIPDESRVHIPQAKPNYEVIGTDLVPQDMVISQRPVEIIDAGKKEFQHTAILIGAGGAGGRLFDGLKPFHEMADEEKNKYMDYFGLTEEQQLKEFLDNVDNYTKPTLPGVTAITRKSSLQVILETLAAENPNATVVIGLGPATTVQIRKFLKDEFNRSGTYFGLKQVALVEDRVIPIVDINGRIVLNAPDNDGKYPKGVMYQGAEGGAGSIRALASKTDILQQDGTQISVQNGYQWLSQKGLQKVMIWDGDTAGLNPGLLYGALGTSKGQNLVCVGFNYPHENEINETGKRVHKIGYGTFFIQKRSKDGTIGNVVTILEYKERPQALQDKIFEVEDKNGYVLANINSFVVAPVELLAETVSMYPWHLQSDKPAPGSTLEADNKKADKFEKFKPDVPDLTDQLINAQGKPFEIKLFRAIGPEDPNKREFIPVKFADSVKEERETHVRRDIATLRELGVTVEAGAVIEIAPGTKITAGKGVVVKSNDKVYLEGLVNLPNDLAAAKTKAMQWAVSAGAVGGFQRSVLDVIENEKGLAWSVSGLRYRLPPVLVNDSDYLRELNNLGNLGLLNSYLYLDDIINKNPGESEYRIVLGHDTRPSWKRLIPNITKGLLAAAKAKNVKLEIIYVGIMPKPVIMNYARHVKAHGTINLTCSHNEMGPYLGILPTVPEFAGWELSQSGITESGAGLLDSETAVRIINQTKQTIADTSKLSEILTNSNLITDQQIAPIVNQQFVDSRRSDIVSAYVDFLKKALEIDNDLLAQLSEAFRNFRVVFDANGSSAINVYPEAWAAFGLNLDDNHVINKEQRHSPLPEGRNLDSLVATLRQVGAMLGLAVDVDADRGTIVIGNVSDPEHNILSAQQSASLIVTTGLARAIIKNPDRRFAIVMNDASSTRLVEIAKTLGKHFGVNIETYYVETGEANVVTKMRKLEDQGVWVIGTEASNGGVIWPKSRCRDGSLALLHLSLAAIDQSLLNNIAQAFNFNVEPGKQVTLENIIQALPSEWNTAGNARFTLSVEDPKAKVEVPSEIDSVPGLDILKGKLIAEFFRHFRTNLMTRGYKNLNVRFTTGIDETLAETTEKAISDIPVAGIGGIKFSFDGIDKRESSVWYRKSGTEPEPRTLRMIPDAISKLEQDGLAILGKNLFANALYKTIGSTPATEKTLRSVVVAVAPTAQTLNYLMELGFDEERIKVISETDPVAIAARIKEISLQHPIELIINGLGEDIARQISAILAGQRLNVVNVSELDITAREVIVHSL